MFPCPALRIRNPSRALVTWTALRPSGSVLCATLTAFPVVPFSLPFSVRISSASGARPTDPYHPSIRFSSHPNTTLTLPQLSSSQTHPRVEHGFLRLRTRIPSHPSGLVCAVLPPWTSAHHAKNPYTAKTSVGMQKCQWHVGRLGGVFGT